MGPIALFDKSFLQSLKLDESVWFDNYFLTNVCPLFYIETLADLENAGKKGRSAEAEVRIIADKFPPMNSGPCAHHHDLCLASLLGYDVPMIGQIPLAQSRIVMHEGEPNVVADESAVAAAYSRWQEGRYLEVERLFAKIWRNALANIDLGKTAELYRTFGINPKSVKSLEQAVSLAQTLTVEVAQPDLRIRFALLLLDIEPEDWDPIMERWDAADSPSILEYAPYASFVISILIFFNISLASGLISTKRPSNFVDIAYLFYLPFCMIFISSDRLHRNTAPFFLRNGQEFVWGQDLKAALGEINTHFSTFPESEKDKGIAAFARTPPDGVGELVTQLWDNHLPRWSEPREKPADADDQFDQIKAKVAQMEAAQTAEINPSEFKVSDVQSVAMKRVVRKKRGSWYQIPKNLGEG